MINDVYAYVGQSFDQHSQSAEAGSNCLYPVAHVEQPSLCQFVSYIWLETRNQSFPMGHVTSL